MLYISAEKISKSFGIKLLFKELTFHISEGDKIALVAKNGSGKSTLLKIISGKEMPDEGSLQIHKDISVILFEQDPHFRAGITVFQHIFQSDHPVASAVKNYETALEKNNPGELQRAIAQMDELDAWNFEVQVKQVLSRLRVDQFHQPVETLSGGQKKRLALAQVLINMNFDHTHTLLIMDEPTNHLDIEMTEWLEQYLQREKITLLVVTHDRYFLDAVCNEIWELDEQKLVRYKGDYLNYIERKVASEESRQATLEKARNTYRKELDWMRKQPKARTTKSKSRELNFEKIEHAASKKQVDAELTLSMKMSRLGGKILELKKVYKSFGKQVILKGFDYTFKKGERIGIIGKNGTGKTTFLQLIQNLIPADSGKVNHGETVVFGHYAQKGLEIKEDMRIIDYVKTFAETFPLAGGGSLNASQFLQLFLFPPEQQYTPLSKLSGGEKKRLQLLTVLFRNPNFLILDEPTNDLDLPTLTVLENYLSEFQGCLIIVSHDRYFMDRLVDHLFVFEGSGVIRDFPGNYSQYRKWWQEQENTSRISRPKSEKNTDSAPPHSTKEQKKLSYNEKRELTSLDEEIPRLEKRRNELAEKMSDAHMSYTEIAALSAKMETLTKELEKKELRWLELQEKMS